MSRIPTFPHTLPLLGTAFLTLALTTSATAQDTQVPGETSAGMAPPMPSGVPRWLEEVRAQRRALQQQRRAQHEALRRAIDPQGSAQQEARKGAFLRRRQETLEQMSQDRRLFMNQGPWSQPPMPVPRSTTQGDAPLDEKEATGYVPPDWDNGWYYQGW